MECTVRWTGLSGMTFLAETGSGHLVSMDGAPAGLRGAWPDVKKAACGAACRSGCVAVRCKADVVPYESPL